MADRQPPNDRHRDNGPDTNLPKMLLQGLLAILGFVSVYFFNKINGNQEELLKQNIQIQSETKNIIEALNTLKLQYGDHERRIRELELDKARRDGGGRGNG